jgi:hypothetical protein
LGRIEGLFLHGRVSAVREFVRELLFFVHGQRKKLFGLLKDLVNVSLGEAVALEKEKAHVPADDGELFGRLGVSQIDGGNDCLFLFHDKSVEQNKWRLDVQVSENGWIQYCMTYSCV